MKIKKFKTKYFYSALIFLFISSTSIAAVIHWSYQGPDGPEFWGDLDPSFAMCKDGMKQSPIDLSNPTSEDAEDHKIRYRSTPLVIINNGHTIQVDYNGNSYILLNNLRYRLLQFHFHTPSEHTKDGQVFPMEAHLVHMNDNGELAVIGIHMRIGEENDFLKAIWANMPTQEATVEVAKEINVKNFLPEDDGHYNYSGSLTTPPCSEGVNWIVLDTPVEISLAQLQAFQAIFPMNARPVQALNVRILSKED